MTYMRRHVILPKINIIREGGGGLHREGGLQIYVPKREGGVLVRRGTSRENTVLQIISCENALHSFVHFHRNFI